MALGNTCAAQAEQVRCNSNRARLVWRTCGSERHLGSAAKVTHEVCRERAGLLTIKVRLQKAAGCAAATASKREREHGGVGVSTCSCLCKRSHEPPHAAEPMRAQRTPRRRKTGPRRRPQRTGQHATHSLPQRVSTGRRGGRARRPSAGPSWAPSSAGGRSRSAAQRSTAQRGAHAEGIWPVPTLSCSRSGRVERARAPLASYAAPGKHLSLGCGPRGLWRLARATTSTMRHTWSFKFRLGAIICHCKIPHGRARESIETNARTPSEATENESAQRQAKRDKEAAWARR
mmetsp:Transcript_3497/g.14157  ORF Transcript_3497/g.14157 Transcript_3497/m.14157 type:complete len:289 (-) Transcript_3497:648-1514(-)